MRIDRAQALFAVRGLHLASTVLLYLMPAAKLAALRAYETALMTGAPDAERLAALETFLAL